MYKLIVLFKKPENEKEFDQFYYEEFLPLSVDIEGLERMELTKVIMPFGITRTDPSPFDLQVEFYFQTKQAFEDFMSESEIGRDFQEKLSYYSDPIYTVAYGQTEMISRSEIIARYNEHVIRTFSH